VARHGNTRHGSNPFFKSLPVKLTKFFAEITESDSMLDEAYVTQRYDGSVAPINRMYPERYPPNALSTWDGRRWRARKSVSTSVRDLKSQIPDKAELHLIDDLLRRVKHIATALKRTGLRTLPPAHPERRLLFIQGNVGTGKTTLMHHFARICLKNLNERSDLPIRFRPAIVPCDPQASETAIESLWPWVLRETRVQIGDATGLDTNEGWEEIARDDIYDSKGEFRPSVSRDPEGQEKAIARIIFQVNGNDGLFIKRAARTLWQRTPREIIVLVIDNIDRHDIPWARQQAICNRVLSLAESSRHILAIVPVREYTLGNFARREAASRYHHLDRMHITAPIVGKMMQRRLRLYYRELGESKELPVAIWIDDRTTIQIADFQAMIDHIANAIDDYRGWRLSRRLDQDELRRRRFSVSNLLLSVTNSDMRAALRMLLNALQSWALNARGAVTHYFYERDKPGRRREVLPPFAFDEILRLMFVGEWEFFDEGNECGLINLFGRHGTMDRPTLGQFNSLLRYRVLEYLNKFGEADRANLISAKELVKALQLYRWPTPMSQTLLQGLLDHGFVESLEGSDARKVKNVIRTRKSVYYMDTLSHLLVYLENVRNDSMIDYRSQPHLVRMDICTDLKEILHFIEFIFGRETEELVFIRNRDASVGKRCKRYLDAFRTRFVGDHPICWKLLRSVAQRANALAKAHPEMFNNYGRTMEVEQEFRAVRDDIVKAWSEGRLLPPMVGKQHRLRMKLWQ
jgi:hypothetical protein